MRTRFAAALILTGIGCGLAPAHAQKAPIWQGWYAGVNGGGESFSGHAQSLTTGAGGDTSASRWAAGLYGGYNWQSGPWVFGIETDWTHTFVPNNPFDMFSARGRAGYAFGTTLIYGTAGIATENRFLYVTKSNGFTTQILGDEQQHTGFTGGGGVETVLTQNLRLRGEVLYFDGGTQHYSYPFAAPLRPSTWTRDFNQLIYRAGLTYHFN